MGITDINFDEVKEASEYKKLAAGGYVCKITNVQDIQDKEYLKISFDIAEGDYKGHYQSLFENTWFWGGNFIKSYKEKALGFLKYFINRVEESNIGYKFKVLEYAQLVGKYIGIVLEEEEYEAQDGSYKTRLKPSKFYKADDIRAKKFTMTKTPINVAQENRPAQQPKTFTNTVNEDLPF